MRKRLLFIICLSRFFTLEANAQSQTKGLEGIIVEKYYVADKKDSKASKGHLPVGSVTYRIYVDLLPSYRLQAVYGVTGHELRIATTTSFYNDEQNGAEVANKINSKKLDSGTLMLDSWLSVCAAADRFRALMKSDDTSKAIVHVDKLLQSKDPSAGIPLTEHDGMIPEYPISVVTFFGMDSTMLSIFGNTNVKTKGQVLSTDNASWASFGGAFGVQPMNRVLIAQLTTDGALSFKLNLQVGTPEGTIENYVAENPVDNEILFPGLIYPQPKKNIPDEGKKDKKNSGTAVTNTHSR